MSQPYLLGEFQIGESPTMFKKKRRNYTNLEDSHLRLSSCLPMYMNSSHMTMHTHTQKGRLSGKKEIQKIPNGSMKKSSAKQLAGTTPMLR